MQCPPQVGGHLLYGSANGGVHCHAKYLFATKGFVAWGDIFHITAKRVDIEAIVSSYQIRIFFLQISTEEQYKLLIYLSFHCK